VTRDYSSSSDSVANRQRSALVMMTKPGKFLLTIERNNLGSLGFCTLSRKE